MSAEWDEELGTSADPALVVLAVEPPDKTGFGSCTRARQRWPGVPIVLATASLPRAEMDLHQATSSGADAYLDKRTLTPDELCAKLQALIGPAPEQAESTSPAAVADPVLAPQPGPPEPGPELGTEDEPVEPRSEREAELEAEVKSLRWELDATVAAVQSAPFSRDFLRLSEVIAVKEREIVRLKKEVFAREHKIATGGRTAREASSRASAATREREADQGEIRRLRVEIQRLTTEAELAVSSLIDERQQHEHARRQHARTLESQAGVLKQVQDDHLTARSAIEAQLREEHDKALDTISARWKNKLKRLRQASAHGLAILHDQIRDQQIALHRELAGKDEAHEAQLARAEEELAAVRASAERQRDELQRLHEVSLGEALAAHVAAEQRAAQLHVDRRADEARLHEEKLQAVATTASEWEGKLDELRRAHADSVSVLRRHFQEQLGHLQTATEQDRSTRYTEHDAALRRAAEELAVTRTQSARLDQEARQQHEIALLRLETSHAEALTVFETRLREEQRQAAAALAGEWAAKLDDLRGEHSSAFDALRRHSLEQLSALKTGAAQALAERDAQHGEALLRVSDELVAVRARAARLEQEQREGHERELARVQAAHVETLAALETHLQEEKEQAVAATGKTWEQTLAELRRTHGASVDALRQQYQGLITALQTSRELELAKTNAEHHAALERAAQEIAAVHAEADAQREELRRLHELALADTATAHADAQSRMAQDHRAAQRATEATLREDQARAVAATVTEWEAKLEQLRSAHASSVEVLRRHATDQLETLQSSLAQELAKRHDEHRLALRQIGAELSAARAEAAQLDQETRQAYELELTRAETTHLEALAVLDASRRAEQEQALATAVASGEARLDELRRAHAATVDTLRKNFQEDLVALQAQHTQTLKHKDAENEAALQRIEEELATAKSRAAHFRQEARQRPEPAAALPAAQVEAMKALEARLAEERERAVAAVVAEWKTKMDRLRRGHADSMAALRREHQDHVAAIEHARQHSAAKQRPLPFGDPSEKVVPIKAGGERSR